MVPNDGRNMNKKEDLSSKLGTPEGINVIAAEALIHFSDNLVAKNICSLDVEADYSNKPLDCKVGDSLEFNVNNFDKELPAKIKNVTIEKHFDVTCELGKIESDFEQFSEETLQPMSYTLAEKVDKYTLSKILECKNVYLSDDLFGCTSGDGSKDLAAMRKAANLQQFGKDRLCLIDYYAEAGLLSQTWFAGAQDRESDDILGCGEIGTTMGLNFYSSMVFPDYTDSNGCKYHGSIFSNSNLGLAMPLVKLTKNKTCCCLTNNGLSLKATVYEEDGIKKLSVECMVSSFLINSDNMILLGENKVLNNTQGYNE